MVLELESEPRGEENRGQYEFNLVHGQGIKLQLGNPEENDELLVAVPEGKKWHGLVVVDFVETDA